MRVEVTCANCEAHCGWDYPGDWGAYGGNPPEYVGIEDYIDDEGVIYCSQACLDEHNINLFEEDEADE